jgi:hypothetical protein
MQRGVGLIVAGLLFALPATALALLEQTFGNAPLGKQPEWAEGVVDVVNLKSRFYSAWVNGNENFYYRGDARAVNEALRAFAKVRDDVRTVVLMPGRGSATPVGGKSIPVDWRLHVPTGIYRTASGRKHAVLTVYVSATRPGLTDRGRVEAWLRDLDSEDFAVRERASQELQRLGNDAKPLLRDALQAAPALESRRRIEALLDRLRDIDVTDLVLPDGLTILTPADVVTAGLKELHGDNRTARGLALDALGRLAALDDRVSPAAAEAFCRDRDPWVRRLAAACLARPGVARAPAVPVLRDGLRDADEYIRDACRRALDQIDHPTTDPAEAARRARECVILAEINEFKQAAARGR